MEKQRGYGMKRKAPGSVRVSLEDAKAGINKMKALKWEDLLVVGKVTSLPYPGIGNPPPRPGGPFDFVGMVDLQEVLDCLTDLGAGKALLVEGPRGIGKSCILRALAWIHILQANDHQKVLCIWAMEAALRVGSLVDVVKDGLRFAYCFQDSVLAEIESLRSMAGIVEFIRSRKLKGDIFSLIVDGAEYMDVQDLTGAAKVERQELRKSVDSLANEAFKRVYGAPIVPWNKMHPEMSIVVRLQDGFANEEYDAYVGKVSVLKAVCLAFPGYADLINYYGGQHPLSLAVLDYSFRKRAASKLAGWGTWSSRVQTPDNKQTLELLPDAEDIQAALDMFVSSSEVEAIRESIAVLLRKYREHGVAMASLYSQDEMIELDARYAVEGGDYCTQFIKRIYVEEFRSADRVFGGAPAWLPYCKYLLKNPVGVNWAEMGWLCEHLIGDALLMGGGLDLDGFHVQNVRSRGFTTVPKFADWHSEVGDGVFFIPLKYNYGSIDGLLVIRIQGKLHLFAIQITVNASRHYHSAEEFMNLSVVEEWIPNILAKRDEWELHFVFVCCESKAAVKVAPELKATRSGSAFGTLAYTMHQVTFQSLLANSISSDLKTVLEEIAIRRTPEEERDSAPAGAAGAAAQTTAAGPKLVERLLAYSDRKKLNQIAQDEGVALDPKLKKPEFVLQLAAKLACKDGDGDSEGGAAQGQGCKKAEEAGSSKKRSNPKDAAGATGDAAAASAKKKKIKDGNGDSEAGQGKAGSSKKAEEAGSLKKRSKPKDAALDAAAASAKKNKK
ncbi:hypothetical protein SELMODRAFT_418248 [Selaginella moellendorffii]|uniref:Uncharacterized protein n=2 Tax=Selaginella moellendorffii TaxID=88036 RepID=D8S549_SELML|nr:hypothetical protein SELMODRAFT_418248 [Selaginella moellendorffii]